MIYIFTESITDFKNFIGGAVNASMDMASLKPMVKDAFFNHLERWLGEAQWNRLVAGVSADDLTAEENTLLPYVQEAIAYLTLYQYSSVGTVQFTSSGLQREEGETNKTAYKYQVNEYRDYFLTQGYEALERLLLFLSVNESDYPLWQASDGYTEAFALFINDTRTFRKHYNFDITRYTFEHLRGLMKDLDLFVAEACFGSAFTKDLKSKIKLGTLSVEELELVQWTQRAIAQFAIEEALRRQSVLIKGRRVIIQESLEPQSYIREGVPSTNQFSIKIKHHSEWAKRLWSKALDFLDQNKDAFPLYTDYLDSLVEEVGCPDREENTPLKTFDYGFSNGGQKIIVL